MSGIALARSAESLIGAPFRLHGRDPRTGIDCIGLFTAALERIGRSHTLPSGYTLRLRGIEAWLPEPASCGCEPASDPVRPGDVVLSHLIPAQFHLAIAATDGGWIHAHAGIGRVVHSLALPEGRIVRHRRMLPQV